MVMPTEQLFTALAADRGLQLSPERIEAARAMHVRFRQELELLRSVRLEFLPPYIEPQTAVRWIERGVGRSEPAGRSRGRGAAGGLPHEAASPVEAVQSCLDRIERLDGQVKSVLTLLPDLALEAAEASTARWRRGNARIPRGCPIRPEGHHRDGRDPYHWRVGDLLVVGASENATIVDRLNDAGAVLTAKLYTFEFAGGANATTCNPWDLERTAAGSSSGSATAVASRELPLTVGTDTGGSIAIPAAFVGISGLKPTYGRVPRTGIMPLSWTLDHAGPMTRSALDAALALQVMAGHDNGDPNSGANPVPDYTASINDGVKGLRIGVPSTGSSTSAIPRLPKRPTQPFGSSSRPAPPCTRSPFHRLVKSSSTRSS